MSMLCSLLPPSSLTLVLAILRTDLFLRPTRPGPQQIIWKQSQELLYLEEQMDFLRQEVEERPKVIAKEAKSTIEDPGDPANAEAVGMAARRSQTLNEKLIEMYWHADSNAVKPFPLSGCREAIPAIIAGKVWLSRARSAVDWMMAGHRGRWARRDHGLCSC